MGKPDKYRSSSRDRGRNESSGESPHYYGAKSRDEGRSDKKYKERKKYDNEDDEDSEKERRKREKKDRDRREKEGNLGDGARSGGYGRPSSRPQSRERERGFPAEHGYGRYQESQGWGERPNVQTYGHPGLGGQPQTYQPPPPPDGAYDQGGYGSGQGVYAHQPTSPPPVQYQPFAYQQPGYGGGGGGDVYGGSYQTGPTAPPPGGGDVYGGSYQAGPTAPPPAGYGGSYNQGYPPPSGPPPQQGHGHYPTEQSGYEYRPQEQPVAYGGYQPQAPYVQEQGPYSQGYQPQPGPPPGTPGYHSPLPNLSYGPPSGPGAPSHGVAAVYGAIGGAYTAGGATTSQHFTPQHHSTQQHQYQDSGPYGTPITYADTGAIQPTITLNPANLGAKPGAAVSALNTFTTGMNSALHTYARTLFPATSSHKNPAGTGDSGAPYQVTDNRFDSFAPVRGGNGAKWYVDGKDYMYAVSIALERAEKSIWIMDWWLTPELYLRRPPALNEEYRLDRMLKRAAERGVHINIIVYKEVPQALTLSSHHTKTSLESLHANIAVFRHPDHLPDRPTIQSDIFKKLTTGTYQIGDGLKGIYGMKNGVVLYWAHHEKLCLIDGEIAFMGGLDLCFGRWDMSHHPIADVHPNDIRQIVFPGQDFNNARFMDFHTVDHWEQNKVSRTENSRMGWTDVALSVIGPSVKDLQRHFFDRWNFIFAEKYRVRQQLRYQPLDERVLQGHGYHRRKIKSKIHGVGRAFLEGTDPLHYEEEQEEHAYGHEDLSGVQCQIVRSASKWSHGLPVTEHSIAHAYIEIITSAKHFIYIENQFFITATDDKQNPIMNKIGRAIVDRILRAASERQKFRIIVIMPAIPAFAGDLQPEGSLGTRAIMEFQYRSINNDRGFSIMEQIARAGVDPKQYIRFYNLRSYDRINLSRTMDHTQQAAGVSYGAAAAALGQKTSGYNPAAYGYPQVHGNEDLRYQQAATGGGSEWDSVAKCSMLGGGDIRQVPWNGDPAKEMDSFVSEELYIHSKLLIADDRIVICGSANLNDRSQLGDHDSEIAIIIDDPTSLPSAMDGVQFQASHFAATLRRQIFRKHLGLIPAQNLTHLDENMEPVPVPNIYDFDSEEDRLVADPLSDRFWDFWNYTAKTNTDAFGKAFHPVPHDSVQNWKQYDEWWTRWFVPSKEEKVRVEKLNKEKLAAASAAKDAAKKDAAKKDAAKKDAAKKETVKKETVKKETVKEGDSKKECAITEKKKKPEGEKPKPLVEWGRVVKAEFSEGAQGVGELKELLSRIRGHLVEMPLEFLREEDIAKEGLELNALTETIYT